MANGQETGIEILRGVIALRARGGDWNSVRDFHQGQRSATALKGRIHDRTPTRLPKHQKALAERGPSIHDTAVVVRSTRPLRRFNLKMKRALYRAGFSGRRTEPSTMSAAR